MKNIIASKSIICFAENFNCHYQTLNTSEFKKEIIQMPICKFYCATCDLIFDKILTSSTSSDLKCSRCNSSELRRVSPEKRYHSGSIQTSIPSGALSGGSCAPGFS